MRILLVCFALFAISFGQNLDDKFRQAVRAFNDANCTEAAKIYEELVEKGHIEAIYNYAWMREKASCVEGDYKDAISLYERAIKEGDERIKALASYRMGLLFATGRGVEQNVTQAKEFWQTSENLGYAQASYSLGMLYYQGMEGKKDENIAREYFKKACQGGVKQACVFSEKIGK